MCTRGYRLSQNLRQVRKLKTSQSEAFLRQHYPSKQVQDLREKTPVVAGKNLLQGALSLAEKKGRSGCKGERRSKAGWTSGVLVGEEKCV